MITMEIYKSGDLIEVRCIGDDEWVVGEVVMASENGRSIAIALDGAVRAGSGFLGNILPLFVTEHSVKGVITDDEYEVRRA